MSLPDFVTPEALNGAASPKAPSESGSLYVRSPGWEEPPGPLPDEPRTTLDWETGAERPRAQCTHVYDAGPWEGKRCRRLEDFARGVCNTHGATPPEATHEHRYQEAVRKLHARRVLDQAAPHAAGHLITLMASAAKDETQLRAAEQILDRTGIRGGTEVQLTGEVTVSPATEVRERLERISSRLMPRPPESPAIGDNDDEIHEAEVVNDQAHDPTAPEPPATTSDLATPVIGDAPNGAPPAPW